MRQSQQIKSRHCFSISPSLSPFSTRRNTEKSATFLRLLAVLLTEKGRITEDNRALDFPMLIVKFYRVKKSY